MHIRTNGRKTHLYLYATQNDAIIDFYLILNYFFAFVDYIFPSSILSLQGIVLTVLSDMNLYKMGKC